LKRLALLTLILVVSLAGIFLLMRQVVIENIKASTSQTMRIAEDGFKRKVVEWQSDLQFLARHESAIRIAARTVPRSQVTRNARNVEDYFRQFLKLRKQFVKSVRLVDRYGRERIVVDENGPSRHFMNVEKDAFFQRGMAQRPFESVGTLVFDGEKTNFEFTIPLMADGFSVGVISLGLDISAIADYFTSFGESFKFNHVYVIDEQANIIFQKAFEVREESRPEKTAKKVYLSFVNEATDVPVLESDGAIWAYLNSDAFKFSFLLEMENDLLMQRVLDKFIPAGSLFLVAAIFLIVFRNKRKRYVRKGSLVVPDVNMRKGGSGKNTGNDASVRLKDLANISHEIRTPLNNVLGMLSLLRISRLDNKQKEYLDLATRYSEWILELLNEITDFSALKKGKLKLDKIEFNIRQTIKDVTEILSVEAYKKGLDIVSLVNAEVPERVIGDPTRLRQILVNLIGNGVKFTEHGDISVNVTLEKLKDGKATVRIEVTDTGVGIDAEIAHTVFTEFEKTEIIPEGENTGVGLGLSITKQLVEMMGGKIGFRENSLGGSTFWLTLPLKVANSIEHVLAKGKLNGLTAFMLGENASNRKSIASALSNWGVSCDTSGNFESALSILSRSKQSNRPYDILILDISISSATDKAFELVRHMREDVNIQNIQVLLLTSHGIPGDSMVAKDLGIRAYLTKPINRSDLKKALLELRRELPDSYSNELVTRHSLREQDENTPVALVVENNRTYQKLIVGMLARLGVVADLAENEKEAFEAIKSRSYGLLLVDYQLPDVPVLEFVQRVKGYEARLSSSKKENQDERALGTPVVLLSTQLSERDTEACMRAGTDDILSKPINIDRLANLLCKWDLIEADVFGQTEMVG